MGNGITICGHDGHGLSSRSSHSDRGLVALGPRKKDRSSFFWSFIGFALSTICALLAIATIVYAVASHSFAYHDPWLLGIFRWGALLSFCGVILGLTGISKPTGLRWQAPLAGVEMLAFWIVAAAGE